MAIIKNPIIVINSSTPTPTTTYGIEFTDDVSIITNSMFYDNQAIKSVVLPNTIGEIEASAFEICSNLESITIPASIESIGDYAFSGCDSLQNVTVYATTPPTLGTDVFNDTCTIYVPASSLSAYLNDTDWSVYSSQIQTIV